jgi:hypothetical protein
LSRGISPRTRQPAYAPFKPSDSEQRSLGSSYRGCWHELSPSFLQGWIRLAAFSPSTGLYNPKAFVAHAASLGRACAHCRRSSTAATRRCLASVSVRVARVVLSHPLGISPLVGRYPANQVIPRRPRPGRRSFALPRSSGITPPLGGLSRTPGWVPTPYCPLRRFPPVARGFPRLACLIHAANVRSEPGSNPSKVFVSPSPEEEGSCLASDSRRPNRPVTNHQPTLAGRPTVGTGSADRRPFPTPPPTTTHLSKITVLRLLPCGSRRRVRRSRSGDRGMIRRTLGGVNHRVKKLETRSTAPRRPSKSGGRRPSSLAHWLGGQGDIKRVWRVAATPSSTNGCPPRFSRWPRRPP